MNNVAPEKRYRYPGLLPFEVQDERLFYGREREARDLCAQVMVERIVVLFSKSGMGKSSLLNAGLTPLLEKTNILPVRVRLNSEGVPPERQFLQQLEEQKAFVRLNASLDRDAASLWEQVKFARFNKNNAPAVPLFLLDQFEEIFTLYTPSQRKRFLEEIADLANGTAPEYYQHRLRERIAAGEKLSGTQIIELEQSPRVKIIFSIRSDLLHLLNALSPLVPDIMRSRFELQPLTVEQAEEAIVLPAMLRDPERNFASRIFQYDEKSLGLMLNHLTRKGQDDVESFQLQILCRYIERLVIEKQSDLSGTGGKRVVVTPDLFEGEKGIEAILRNFYTDQLAVLPATDQPVARKIIEEELITENERRRSVSEEDLFHLGASRTLLDRLVEMRLLRKEPRLKTFYYEISHDTLVPPILVKYKERRFEEEQADALRKAEAERLENARKAEEAEARVKEETRKRAEAERLQKEAETARQEAEQQRRIAEAQRQLAELGRKRAVQRTRWAIGGGILAVAALILAYVLNEKSQENLKNYLGEQAKNTELLASEYIGRGDELREVGFPRSAAEMYREADSIRLRLLENENIRKVIEQKQRHFESSQIELLRVQIKDLEISYREYFNRGDELFNAGYYKSAAEMYREAEGLFEKFPTEYQPEFIKEQQPELKLKILQTDSLIKIGGQ